MRWFIGCSGFHYRHWKPGFYPDDLPQRLWFEYYMERFNTLELNTTFYNFPKPEYLNGWYKRSAASFKFTVKAPRLITHYKKFTGVGEVCNDFYKVIKEGLKKKLGVVLFQLPPNVHYKEEKLQQIISNLNPAFLNAVEFRHASWWNKAVYEALSARNIIFCSISHPQLPHDIIFNTPVAYLRLHGTPNLYSSIYTLTELKTFYKNVSTRKKLAACYVYFNNDIHLGAIKNGMQMQQLAGVTKGGKVWV